MPVFLVEIFIMWYSIVKLKMDGYDADAIRYVDVERIGIYYITKILK